MPKAGGKWSTMEITAKGRDLSVMFDGKKTASVRSGVHTEGPLALQFGEGVVKFRKVAIKLLRPRLACVFSENIVSAQICLTRCCAPALHAFLSQLRSA
jgi:hypothetical protein